MFIDLSPHSHCCSNKIILSYPSDKILIIFKNYVCADDFLKFMEKILVGF